MNASSENPIRRATRSNLSRGLLGALAVALLPMAALAADQVDYTPDYTRFMDHDHHGGQDSALVKKVHDAVKKYKNIRQALVVENPDPMHPQWVVGTPCVSGPETGAMGIHIVNPGRTATGSIFSSTPSRPRMRVAFGASWMPAPTSAKLFERSTSVTAPPRRARHSAAESPPMPPPTTSVSGSTSDGMVFTLGRYSAERNSLQL